MNFVPAIKGLISAVLMIAASLITFYSLPGDSPLHYVVYVLYGVGIIWTATAHQSVTGDRSFWGLFNAGFRSFVVTLLVMVIYTFVFNKMHPEFAERSSIAYKEKLVADEQAKKPEDRSMTPVQIEEATSRYKRGYAMAVVYGSIFGYLIIGVVVTAITSVLLTRRT